MHGQMKRESDVQSMAMLTGFYVGDDSPRSIMY